MKCKYCKTYYKNKNEYGHCWSCEVNRKIIGCYGEVMAMSNDRIAGKASRSYWANKLIQILLVKQIKSSPNSNHSNTFLQSNSTKSVTGTLLAFMI
jgi:hypothetical protein